MFSCAFRRKSPAESIDMRYEYDSRAGQCSAALANRGKSGKSYLFPDAAFFVPPELLVKGNGKSSKTTSCHDFMNHKCTCDNFSGKYFCTARRCSNDVHATRPVGSSADGRVGTDEGSLWNTINRTRIEANPVPKPSDQHNEDCNKAMNSMQTSINNADECTNSEILESLMQAASMLAVQNQDEYWMSGDGQTELLMRIDVRNEKPAS